MASQGNGVQTPGQLRRLRLREVAAAVDRRREEDLQREHDPRLELLDHAREVGEYGEEYTAEYYGARRQRRRGGEEGGGEE